MNVLQGHAVAISVGADAREKFCVIVILLQMVHEIGQRDDAANRDADALLEFTYGGHSASPTDLFAVQRDEDAGRLGPRSSD